jgi:hypothetical protein
MPAMDAETPPDAEPAPKKSKPRPALSRGRDAASPPRYSPVQNFDEDAPNPEQPRKWPLYLFVSLTVGLVLLAFNLEQQSEDATHWAAPSATGIEQPLVARSIMDLPESLPTRVPQAYLDEVAAVFAVTDELPTTVPVVTAAAVTGTPTPTKTPLLKKGMQSGTVREVQERLAALHYLPPELVDGKYESATVRAIKAFQENSYMDADGMAGKETLEALFGESAVPAVTPTPAPTRLDEPSVWATKNGTYYHSLSNCSNMKGAVEIGLSEAKAQKKKACPKCSPPE